MVDRTDKTEAEWRARLMPLLLLLVLAACGGVEPPPQPGQERGVAPDLRGRTVLLLPVQHVAGVRGDVDAELAFAVQGSGQEVEWVDDEEMSEILARSPGVRARTTGLPVGQFLSAEVRRIGDPLFGQLRRMAALVEADAVFLPVAATFEPNQSVPDAEPRVRLTVALVESRTGRVLWFAVEEGGAFEQDDPRGLASAAERIARGLFWYVG